MERPIELNFFSNPILVPGLLVLVIIVGLFSGSYPALIMSSLRPAQVLKGNGETFSGSRLQRWLIVVQYAVSITLVISSLVIYRQLAYMQDRELGYSKTNIITIRLRDDALFDNRQNLKNEWAQNPNIFSTTTSSHLPINIRSSQIINDDPGGSKEDDLAIYQFDADPDFLDVFDIKLLAGRNFSNAFKSDDEDAYLINETAARRLAGLPRKQLVNR